MEIAKLENEYEYDILRSELLQLKKNYLKDIRAGNIPELTAIFIEKSREIQTRYLDFLHKYLVQESEVSPLDFIRTIDTVF